MSSSSINKLAGGTKTQDSDSAGDAQEILVEAPIDISAKLPSFADLLPEQLLPYWQLIQKYPVLEAFTIIALFWVLAYVVRRYVVNLVSKLASHTEGNLDDKIIDAVRPPVFKAIIAIGVIIGTRSAGFVEGAAQYIAPVILTWVVISITRAALTISSSVISSLAHQPNRFASIDVRTEPLIIIVSKILILIMAAYVGLLVWGINPVGLLASAGIVGIAVGFAAKDTLANLFSGMFILADQPYKLGDYVNLDSGERGRITHIGIRSTRIMTRDDIEVTVPNGVIGNGKVVNESGGPRHRIRIRMDVQCSYESDLEEVIALLIEVASAQEKVCKSPAPAVRVRGFGESGINLQLRCHIDEPKDRGFTQHTLYLEIHKAFRKHNIEIPYPKRDLNIHNQSS